MGHAGHGMGGNYVTALTRMLTARWDVIITNGASWRSHIRNNRKFEEKADTPCVSVQIRGGLIFVMEGVTTVTAVDKTIIAMFAIFAGYLAHHQTSYSGPSFQSCRAAGYSWIACQTYAR